MTFLDDVNAIIFVVAISEYDQSLREDNKTVGFHFLCPNESRKLYFVFVVK